MFSDWCESMLNEHQSIFLLATIGIGLSFGFLARRALFRTNGSKISTIMESFDSSLTGNTEYKMVLVIRNDLKMGKGKACAQCSHAAVLAYTQARKSKNLLKNWLQSGQRKVVCKVDNEDELLEVMRKAKQQGLISVLIRDAGRTQVESGTKTVVGIGPAKAELIDLVTGNLKLY